MGSETMGVLSNFEGLHPMRDGMRNERLVDYYFGIIGRMNSKWVDKGYGIEIRWILANEIRDEWYSRWSLVNRNASCGGINVEHNWCQSLRIQVGISGNLIFILLSNLINWKLFDVGWIICWVLLFLLIGELVW